MWCITILCNIAAAAAAAGSCLSAAQYQVRELYFEADGHNMAQRAKLEYASIHLGYRVMDELLSSTLLARRSAHAGATGVCITCFARLAVCNF